VQRFHVDAGLVQEGVISTMAPKATKMSSPKNRPTLSVAAA